MRYEKVTLPSGNIRWEGYAEGPPNPVNGKRQQIRRRGQTKREVKQKIEKALNTIKMDDIDVQRAKNITFQEVASEWFAVYQQSGNKETSIRLRRHEIDVLNNKFGQAKIEKIDFRLYQKVLYELHQIYAESSLRSIHACANMIFKYARKARLIKDNPGDDIELPKKQKTVDEIKSDNIDQKYLESHELNEFLDVVSKHGRPLDRECFFLLAFTGMRPGEMCALKRPDLDFEKNLIDISKTIFSPNNNMREFELTPPKTKGSVRVIEVEQDLMDMLANVINENKKQKLKYRTEFDDYLDDDFVFCRTNGYPFSPNHLWHRMRRIMGMTSIQKRATPHIFRHTHISMLTQEGDELPNIMERVGHDSPDTTLKVYTHVTNKMKKESSAKVKSLYQKTLQKINS
ncbi:tyrosine-type recombinase/integrase [Alkalibacillus sp. S2W]|uniref:tyrosine-type recombinase/integrase n=1 Tax=Alkalibacillus sp. S2W TaxID=3386553 RepID=UPI00398D4709